MEPAEKQEFNKFDALNFNLKNKITDYFSFESTAKNLIPVCKSFKSAFYNRREMQPILKSYKEIFTQINLKNKKIRKIKKKFFYIFDQLEDKQQIKDEILKFFLLNKQPKNQKSLSISSETLNSEDYDFIIVRDEFLKSEKKQILKYKKKYFIDSRDINFEFFSYLLAKKEHLLFFEIFFNECLFKNDKQINTDNFNNNNNSEELNDENFIEEASEEHNKAKAPAKINENLALLCDALNNKNLKIFNFGYNFSLNQNQADKDFLLSTIHGLKSIEDLNLQGNYLFLNEKDASNMSIIIKENVKLIKLNLSWNRLSEGKRNLKFLSDALVSNRTLIELTLIHCDIGRNPDNLLNLKSILEGNNSLKILDLEYNNIGYNPYDVILFFEGLAKNKCLKTVNLSENLLGENKICLYHIFRCLHENKTLENLNLQENHITREDSIYFTNYFELVPPKLNIKKLNFGLNSINLNFFNKVFQNNYSIEELDFSCNQFENSNSEDFTNFCKILAKNKSLSILNLRYNLIGRSVISMNNFKDALIENTTLQKIDLKYNEFGHCEEFWKKDNFYFKDIIENNEVLNKFYFCESNDLWKRNKVDVSSKFLEGLLKNKSLVRIDLSSFQIGKSKVFVLLLKQIIENHPSLKAINLYDNYLADEAENFSLFCDAIEKAEKLEKLILRKNNLGKDENGIFAVLQSN